jgi:ABC-type multidrug transport system ATPase subunit
MGGVRQFNSLLRKNLLLKTRRPGATLFEMGLPLVLFLLLVYVRQKVAPSDHGLVEFDHNEIYPLSHSVARNLRQTYETARNDMEDTFGVDMQTQYENDEPSCDEAIEQLEPASVKEAAKTMSREMKCSEVMKEMKSASKAMTRLMEEDPNMTSENCVAAMDKLRQWGADKVMKTLNNQECSNTMQVLKDVVDAMQKLEEATFAKLMKELEQMDCAQQLERLKQMGVAAPKEQDCKWVQKTIRELGLSEGNGVDKLKTLTQQNHMQELAEILMGDSMCNSTMPENVHHDDMMADVMVPFLAMKYDGKTVAHHVLHGSATKQAEQVEHALEHARSWNVAGWIEEIETQRAKYLQSEWPRRVADAAKRVDEELQLMVADLDNPGASYQDKRVDEMVAELCGMHVTREENINPSAAASTSAESSQASASNSINGEQLAKDLKYLQETLDDAGITSWINSADSWGHAALTTKDIAKMTGTVAEALEDVQAESMAKTVDTAAYWLSYFVRSRSPTARLLGEQPSEDMDWESMQFPGAQYPPPTDLRTPIGGTVYQGVRTLQNPEDKGMMDEAMGHEWTKMSARMEEFTTNETSGTADSTTSSDSEYSFMQMWEDIRMNDNMGVQQVVLPKMEARWQAQCPKSLDKARISKALAKTRNGCPFYRKQVRNLASVNFEQEIARLHDHLEKWNIKETLDIAERMHNQFREDVNAKQVADMVHDVLERVHGDGTTTVDVLVKEAKSSNNEQDKARKLALALSYHSREEMASRMDVCKKRRLNKKDHLNKDTKQYESVLTELMERKILIAPYKGEVRQLMHLLFVEFAFSVTTVNENTRLDKFEPFLEALLRCPVIKAAAARATEYFMKDRMLAFDSQAALEAYARDHDKNVLFALVFRNADSEGNFPTGQFSVDYSIRAHAQFLPPTSKILRLAENAMFGGMGISFHPYIHTYVAHLQEIMGRSVAHLRASHEKKDARYSSLGVNIAASTRIDSARRSAYALQQFPAPSYKVDRFIWYIQHTMPMFMVLGWIYAVSLLVKEIVYEKQEKLRDVMRIQGLKTWVYWASWVASAMVNMTFLVALVTAIICGGQVLTHSDASAVFFFLWIYSLSTVSFSMLVSTFFSRAKVAAACGGLLYYVAYLPYAVFNRFEDVTNIHGKNAMCLLAPTGMGIGSAIIAKWELTEEGLQWSNFGTPPPVTNSGAAPKDDFSLSHVCVMLLVDAVLYQILAWYMEKINPGTYGLPQPFYFPFLPSYWCGRKDVEDVVELDDSEEAERTGNPHVQCWEAPPSGLKAMVKIRGLMKTFNSGKRALKGISLDMHHGTIVGLLGHNGAGKSTTMAILTGLYPPTAGDVHVNGRSVRKDSHGVRRQLGVCLQHNALYEQISVEEHLSLFCCLKSVPWNQMKSTVEGLLQDIGLAKKRHAPSKALSGGMKRKLSIGIALSGGSKVVTLDEPTAGVDATSRRDIWQLLAAQKAHRTILLSTHFMDEADILSDRIAIIAEGELTAIGSSMTLKRHYADSYMLTLVAVDGADPGKLYGAVRDAVPQAKFAGARGRELSYCLPGNARSDFSKLFNHLQSAENCTKLGIDTYGLSAATMEEVFLQASSVFEKGLSGMVRNAADDETSDEKKAPPQLMKQHSWDEISTTSGSSNPSNPSLSRSEESSSRGAVDKVQRENTVNSSATIEKELGPQSPHSMITCQPEVSEVDYAPPTADNLEEPPRKPKKEKTETAGIDSDLVPVIPQKTMTLWRGPSLWKQQFSGLFRKRLLSALRDKRAWVSQLLLPALFVVFALIIAHLLTVKEDEPELRLSTDMFIGTTQAGGVTSSMEQHLVPWADVLTDAYGKEVLAGFQHAKGAHDVLQPISLGPNQTMTGYLLQNNQDLKLKTFGAVEVGGSAEFPNTTIWFKGKAYHGVPSFTNIFNNARFKMLGYGDSRVNIWSHPLPKSQALMQEEMTGNSQILVDLTVAITVLLAMGFIPASFVVYLVHEKSSSGKHQQLLSGITPTMYWVTSYFWDMVNYLVPLFVCFLIFVTFNVPAYSGGNSGAILMLLLSYGFCMTPCMYCLEPLFSIPSTAYVTLICLNIFTGTISVMATLVMDTMGNEINEPELHAMNDLCKAIFPWLLPNYSLGRGLIDIAANHYMNYAYEEFGVCVHDSGKTCFRDPLHYDVVGRYILNLWIMVPVWCLLRMLLEWGCCTRQLKKGLKGMSSQTLQFTETPDADVNQEAARIASGSDDNLVVSNVAKTFTQTRRLCGKRAPPHHAVRGVNVGVPSGECFGLLGVNGAGKTTTMRMITGHTDVGAGDIRVRGCSVQNQRDRARQHLGYCPQFDALPDKLTVRETIALYARIRGVPARSVQETVEQMVQRMCLEAHQSTLCEFLSGGNKRKLSTALALIGEPDVVLLDEPSTGVDVGARRFLWDVIGDIRKAGKAVVLTSHSMEECEVLCTRLTIMVNGQFRCLGSPTQLKAKYGGGYTLMIKALLNDGNDACRRIRNYVAANVPEALLAEESVGLFRYGLGGRGNDKSDDLNVPLARIFGSLEQATKDGGELHGCVSDYTLSQTSLEEVFLHFSQEAEALSSSATPTLQYSCEEARREASDDKIDLE